MSEANESADKPHQATPDRIKKAREKGDVTQSPEVQTAARYIGVLAVIASTGGLFALRAAEGLSGFLTRPQEASAYLLGDGDVWTLFAPAATPVFVVLGTALALVLLTLGLLRAIVFVPSKLAPDLKRISPIKSASQKFGPQGVKEFLRTTVKTLCFGGAAIALGIAATPRLLSRTGASANVLSGELAWLLLAMLSVAVVVSAIAAAIDLPVKHAARLKKLRMSHQEVSDENKESEGSPERKKAQRKRAQELAQGAGLKAVPEADVVVVNPEHYAVALVWDRAGGEVPRCVAKGTDHMALAIKQRALQSGVPIHRDVACARALHATVEIGEPIRREHFAAVAAAIRFADRVRGASRQQNDPFTNA